MIRNLSLALSVVSVVSLCGTLRADEELTPPRRPEISVVSSARLVIASAKDGRTFAGLSYEAGGWDFVTVPEGVKATPVISDGVGALAMSGGEVRVLYAYSPAKGKWGRCRLDEPTTAKCEPFVSANVAAFHVGDTVYAFSGETGTWDSVQAKESPSVSAIHVSVAQPDRLSIFGAGSGRFDSVGLEQLTP